MAEINLMPPEEVGRMFARLGELKLDVSGIKRKFLGCPYGEDSAQVLDIYLPNEGGGPFPVVLFAHGGGWSGGARNDTQLVTFIGGVNRGYAVVSLDYRLIPNIRYPANLFDIKSAMRWIAENSRTYLLDPDRVALTGSSAGAHLVMMAAFTQGQPAFEESPRGPSCVVRAVIEQFGPTDFLKFHPHYDESGYPRAQSPDRGSALDALLGVDANLVPNLVRFINPIDNVHPGIPPVLIQHGRYDPIIPYQQALELHDKIIAIAGADKSELDLSEEFLHADPGYTYDESQHRIFDFLDRNL
ncbi:MAG: alpha/beta hydrolase [Oscillospiraceae bacterium]|nr:alpha/beta hydrolase [Oscillospiraceae bacterium]